MYKKLPHGNIGPVYDEICIKYVFNQNINKIPLNSGRRYPITSKHLATFMLLFKLIKILKPTSIYTGPILVFYVSTSGQNTFITKWIVLYCIKWQSYIHYASIPLSLSLLSVPKMSLFCDSPLLLQLYRCAKIRSDHLYCC
uniref:Uncharacterized protein n=1 Tax=Heterorhabditis bacteriophora TaxID=37862 RepID=A0A1I7WD24_HETBA